MRCGECDKWMKSRECPRERNVNGWYRGPSCDDAPCNQFTPKPAPLPRIRLVIDNT